MKKIINLLFALFVTISLIGCSSSPTPTSVATSYVEEFKTKFNNADLSNLSSEDMFGGDAEKEKEFATMLGDFEYKIENESINGDTATVDATITTYDFGTMFKNYFTDYFTQVFALAFSGATQEEITAKGNEILVEKMEATKEEGKTYTSTVTLQLNKTDDGWAIDEEYNSDELLNAISGDLVEVMSSLSDSFSNSSSN